MDEREESGVRTPGDALNDGLPIAIENILVPPPSPELLSLEMTRAHGLPTLHNALIADKRALGEHRDLLLVNKIKLNRFRAEMRRLSRADVVDTVQRAVAEYADELENLVSKAKNMWLKMATLCILDLMFKNTN